jgi:nucleoside-diphosphate kinase
MSGGPVCAMVWEGKDAVRVGRIIIGATVPTFAELRSIRGSFARVS